MKNIFDDELDNKVKEKAGYILVSEEDNENRHALKKSDEDYYKDFLYDREHPFYQILDREARKYIRTGELFVIRPIIIILINDKNSTEYKLFINNGDKWRQSGEALIGRFLKEKYPDLNIALRGTTCKGLKFLLEAYPDRFNWIRNKLIEKAEEATTEEDEE